jgi:nucleotide-binding universal stress UspA family protein
MYKRIVLAYDGSESGQKALLDCHDIAQWSQAELFLVAVRPMLLNQIGMEGTFYDAELEQHEAKKYQDILAEGLAKLSQSGHKVSGEVLLGESVDQISKYAKRMNIDLIVVGHKHLDSWAARWWRGSVSASLIEHAPCSVLVAII